MIKKIITSVSKQHQQLTSLQNHNFANYKFNIKYCVSCGSRSAYNQLLRHITEKYQSNENTVSIESKTSDSFDGSFEVFLSLDNQQQNQIWSALNGDGRFTEKNLAIFDQRIQSQINQENKQ